VFSTKRRENTGRSLNGDLRGNLTKGDQVESGLLEKGRVERREPCLRQSAYSQVEGGGGRGRKMK